MTRKLFFGALVAITFAGSFAAVAATSNRGSGAGQGQGNQGGGGQTSGPSSSGEGGEYLLQSRAHANGPNRNHQRKRIKLESDNCGCIEAVVKNSSGDVVKRSCNRRPHFDDFLIKYQCRVND